MSKGERISQFVQELEGGGAKAGERRHRGPSVLPRVFPLLE